MGRAPCCDKAKVKKGPWSPEEDAALKSYLQKHGTGGNWIALPLKAGLNRCGKSCRLRWLNYLRPDIKHGGFTQEEDNVIFSLFSKIGSRWSVIASHLPGRTDNDVKNYWNTKLKKRIGLAAKTTSTTTTSTSSDININHGVYGQPLDSDHSNTNTKFQIGSNISPVAFPHDQQQQLLVSSATCSPCTLGLEKSNLNLGSWSGIGSSAAATMIDDGVLMEFGHDQFLNINDLFLNGGFGF